MKVTILQGIPGSGKTTLIPTSDGKTRVVVSADNYFIDANGEYQFDAAKLGEAHNACLREYAVVLTGKGGLPDELVVDNTNTTIEEIARYYGLALAFGHDVRVVYVRCEAAVGAERNVHGVGYDACRVMRDRIELLHLQRPMVAPSWWNWVVVESGQKFDWVVSGWSGS